MAEVQKNTDAAKKDAAPVDDGVKGVEAGAPTFSREYLIENAPAVFGVQGFVVAGALSSAEDQDDFSVDQAERAINTFLGK